MSTNNDTTLAEFVIVAVAVAVAAVAVAVWFGAVTAAVLFGGHTWTGISLAATVNALPALAHHPFDPAQAWPTDIHMPGPVAYWACTLPYLGLEIAAVAAIARRVAQTRRPGVERRLRMGIDPEARFANLDDLAPLWIDQPTKGRVILGRVDGRLVATEDRTAPTPSLPRRLRKTYESRRGDRGAIIAIGPSRCGKTSGLAIPAILEWDGPVIALSVKSDLMGATIEHRRKVGDVKVFDPCDMTWEPTCQWTPLRGAGTYSGARKAAAALVDAANPEPGSTVRFWNEQAQDLLTALLWTAAASNYTIADVVNWVVSIERPGTDRPCHPDILTAALVKDPNEQTAADARRARNQLDGIWSCELEQLTSIYITAKTMIARWDDDTILASASAAGADPPVDLDWLLNPATGANTLYLCAPLHRANQMAPVLGGLVGDLLEQAYTLHGKHNKPIGPILLIVDEAGNWPLHDLPAIASTCAGVGIQLIVIFQSKAQIDAAYAVRADTLISNCITKIFYAGISDHSSLTYGAELLGDEHIRQRQASHDITTAWRGRQTIGDSPTRTPLLPAALLRQLHTGEALLIHNTLRPAHLHNRPWYSNPRLRQHANVEPDRDEP